MAIGILGIVFLSRLNVKHVGQISGGLDSTEKWRNRVAAREVARAQDQGSPEIGRSGAEPAPDRTELFGRPGDGFRVFESRRVGLYRGWLRRQEVVLRQEHRAGEKLFVDYAGATIPIHNPESGEVWDAALFVAVLGASNYTYAEAGLSQGLADWIGAHMRAFEFLGGVPEIVTPDFVPGNKIGVLWRAALCGRAAPGGPPVKAEEVDDGT